MHPPRLLIAGIGNIFCGDDAFGSEVARRLLQQTWPDTVRIVDFGIRSIDLTYALLEDRDVTILVDAAPRGMPPGTLSVIEPELGPPHIAAETNAPPAEQSPSADPLLDGHALDPLRVLRLVQSRGGTFRRLLLVACEPADLGGEEGRLGLSAPVEAAVVEAVPLITELVQDLLAERDPCTNCP